MKKFNNGKPYHGSKLTEGGGLKGTTDITDYFYFLCPKCKDNHVMRILEYEVKSFEDDNKYNEKFMKKAANGFTLAFHLYCEKCKFDDFTKISNTAQQTGLL